MIFGGFERMVAMRYLRARRKEGFISVIAGFSLLGIGLGVATLIVVMILRDLDREGHAPAPWAIALASLAAEAGFTAWAFSQPAQWLALARLVAAA